MSQHMPFSLEGTLCLVQSGPSGQLLHTVRTHLCTLSLVLEGHNCKTYLLQLRVAQAHSF